MPTRDLAAEASDAGRGMPDADKQVRLRVGQRFKQHAIDHAEDGRIGADAQRQRHQGDGGEEGSPAESPQNVFEGPHGEQYVPEGVGVPCRMTFR